MSSRFVIFSQARPGSTMLALSLNSHQHVVCHGEVLSRVGIERLGSPEKLIYTLKGKLRKLFGASLLRERDADPIRFLEEHVWPIEAKHVGFKMVLEDIFLSPHKETYLDYFSNEEILPVILYREDQLAVYASCELLAQNRVRYSFADEETEPDTRQFVVDPKQLERFRSGQLTKLNNLKDRFPSAYIMRYERMREEYSGLIDYLGIGGDPRLKQLTRKTAPADLAEIIANYGDVENLPRTIEL